MCSECHQDMPSECRGNKIRLIRQQWGGKYSFVEVIGKHKEIFTDKLEESKLQRWENDNPEAWRNGELMYTMN